MDDIGRSGIELGRSGMKKPIEIELGRSDPASESNYFGGKVSGEHNSE